jgi:LysM repeat protein
MRDARQVLWGIITALVSVVLLLGVFSLSLAEGSMPKPVPAQPTSIQTTLLQPTPVLITSTPAPATQLPTGTLTFQPSPSLMSLPALLSPTSTFTLVTPSANCPHNPGWVLYIVKTGDTLNGLALKYKTTAAEISRWNCLLTTNLLTGQGIFLPLEPTHTPLSCAAPPTWVIYIVQRGDTLYHLGQAYGIPFTEIMHANCLASSDLQIGQTLNVPPWATHTPSPTSILYFDTPTDTPTGETNTPSVEITPTPTGTLTFP